MNTTVEAIGQLLEHAVAEGHVSKAQVIEVFKVFEQVTHGWASDLSAAEAGEKKLTTSRAQVLRRRADLADAIATNLDETLFLMPERR